MTAHLLACVAGAWKKWVKERTGARKGDTRRVRELPPLACLLLARPFFKVPTTSKHLLRRLLIYRLELLARRYKFVIKCSL